jgi:hypothetical protein
MNWLVAVIVRRRIDFEELQGELFGGQRGRASRVYCTEIQTKEWKEIIEPIELTRLQADGKKGVGTGPLKS